jgi:branched-chain amino acid transport system ATP-binding protein
VHVLRGIDLEIASGRITAILGPNGAGKTTLFNLLTKFLAPSQGRIFYEGADVTASGPAELARRGLCRSFQISAVFPQLTVLENLRVALQRQAGLSWQFWRPRRCLEPLDGDAGELLAAVGLAAFTPSVTAALSYGRKRALELATTLAMNPRVLLLDEPTSGLGQEDVARIAALIRTVARGRTVLMVEHNLGVVAQLSDRITVLQRGEILAEGSYAEISARPDVIEAYMGTGHA